MPKPNYSGALSGAASGAAAGSTFGPWGTAAGAVIGGVTGLFGGGKKKRAKRKSTMDPQQRELYQHRYQAIMGQGPLADIYNYNPQMANQVFDQTIAKPAYRGFQENIVPTVTGQFRQGNIFNSSYAADALAKRGRDVQESLDAQRSQYLYGQEQAARTAKQNAINQQLGMTTFDYQRPTQGNPSAIDQILNAAGPAAGNWLADYLSKKTSAPTTPTSTAYPSPVPAIGA